MNFKLALVTGASSGIGEALCYLLASKGIDLIITGRNVNALNEIADKLQGQVKVIVQPFDLSNADQRKKLIEMIHAFAPDLVINNAGFGLYGDAVDHDTADQLEIVNIDSMAVMELTLEAAKALRSKDRKGTILNVSSAAGFLPYPGFAAYSASKAFVNSLSEALDYEMRPYGIRVLSACPGMVATNFRQRALGNPQAQKPKTARGKGVMTVTFAAEEIWKQIQKQKPIHIFNWRYRALIFMTQILPRCIVLPILKKSIEDIKRPITKS